MKRSLLSLLVCLSMAPGFAQLNLVRNPSFEDTLACPVHLNDDIFLARYWSAIDSNWDWDSVRYSLSIAWDVPDLEHTCGNGFDGGCPNNPFFHHFPRTGNSMVEMLLFTNFRTCGGRNEWNHLQGHLQQRLVNGKKYCVTFYVTMEQTSGYAINKIAAYLDDGSIDTTTDPGRALPWVTPQIVDSSIIDDTINWVKVQGCFTATGNETFITIGVFSDTSNVNTRLAPGLGCEGTYLIDDVSVIPLDSAAQAGPDRVTHHAGDTVQLGVANGAGMPCYWYKKGFAAPIDSGGSTWVHPDTTTSYVVVMDLCGHVTYDTVTVRVGTVGVANVAPALEDVAIYPNPASSAITIEAAAGCQLQVADIVGTTVLATFLTDPKTELPIDRLQPGIYFITITDPVSGAKVVKRVVKE